MATLEDRLSDLITEIGSDVKGLQDDVVAIDEFSYVPFGRSGDLITFTGPRLYFPEDTELISATFSLTTAPTGSSAIFEVLKNGSGTFSSDPAIAASTFLASSGTLAGSTIFSANSDYLQISCSQIGASIPGANLTVLLKMIPA